MLVQPAKPVEALLEKVSAAGCDSFTVWVILVVPFARAERRGLPVTVIVTTGYGSIDEAVQAIRMGAYDFLTKPIDVDNLRLVLQRALRDRALQDEVAMLRAQLQARYQFHNVLSKNPKMHAV